MAAFRDFGPKLICSFWGHFTADFFMGAPLGFDLKSIVQVCVTPAPAPAM
jgi:hypothetical protein